ncbi:hypothetical protein GUJ93_ZPchr0011g27962 [Zizania palustris]|uniref:Uncharacterized protein n=1 Tax=Zizania palustris TaxID=103762 RepID=A0A8J6BT57_ZIZPA|nr:hypothetical protein GUJ93_ZPchr0011g27962 [Zizania palustris]
MPSQLYLYLHRTIFNAWFDHGLAQRQKCLYLHCVWPVRAAVGCGARGACKGGGGTRLQQAAVGATRGLRLGAARAGPARAGAVRGCSRRLRGDARAAVGGGTCGACKGGGDARLQQAAAGAATRMACEGGGSAGAAAGVAEATPGATGSRL